MRCHVKLLVLFCLIAISYVCSPSSNGGEIEKTTDAVSLKYGFTIAEEDELGFEAMATLVRKYGYYGNTHVANYVSQVGKKIVSSVSKRPSIEYVFVVLDTDEINAFACPGGYILLTKGILKVMRNEAELAGVLGHEIAHVEEGHGLQSIATDPIAKEKLSVLKNSLQTGQGYKRKFMDSLLTQKSTEPVTQLVNFDQVKDVLTSDRKIQTGSGSVTIR